MTRVFAYCRVSTADQKTENQVQEIQASGFKIEPFRIVTEKISGSVPASKRPEFIRLLDRLEPGDVLVVTKLDRLGRNTIDVCSTVKKLADRRIRITCLALGNTDLTSPAGKMILTILASIAEFEKDLLKERTAAGLERAKKQGTKLGRRPSFSPEKKSEITRKISEGNSISAIAREYKTSRQTVLRIKNSVSTQN